MKREAFNALVAKMNGKDTTNEWDVVVSYDEDKINGLLRARPISQFENLPISKGTASAENDDTGQTEQREYEFDLKLLKPTLQFDDRYGRASLVFTVSGTYKRVSRKNLPRQKIPAGYQARIGVELFNVLGTFQNEGSSTRFTPNSSTSSLDNTGPNNSATVSPERDTARGVCLSFRRSSIEFEGVPDPSKFPSTVAFALEDGMRRSLSQNTQDHFIAGVTGYIGDPGMIMIRPKSFCFTVTPRDEREGTAGFLSMWIDVEGGSHNGLQPSGQTTLSFQPDGRGTSPIPQQASASIIFSHDIIARLFFLPNLKHSFDDVKITSSKETGGISFTGKLRCPDVIVPASRTRVDVPEKCHEEERSFGELRFPTSAPPATITVKPGIVTFSDDAIVISYESESQTANWSLTYYAICSSPTPQYGAVTATISWKAKGHWEGGTTTQPNLLRAVYAPDKNWTFKGEDTIPDSISGILRRIFPQTVDVPDHYQQLQPPVIGIDLKMNALDYFLTTNLLFPGKHVFRSHHPVVEDEKEKKGLGVPRDLILTGDIISPSN